MTREAVGAALLVLGAIVLRLVVSGEYLLFVKDSLAIPLLLSAALLVGLGAMELRGSVRGGRDHDHEHGDDDVDHDGDPEHGGQGHDPTGHDHGVTPLADEGAEHGGHAHVGAGPRMGVLLLSPLFVLMLVPAAPLGAFAANNGAANAIPDLQVYDPLPAATDGAVDVVLPEIIGRTLVEPEGIEGVDVRTIGFVVPDEEQPGSYLLSRFTVGCCAVDAAPFQLRVDAGTADVPAREQWVEVVLRFDGAVEETEDGEKRPVLELLEQQLIDEPDIPYVY